MTMFSFQQKSVLIVGGSSGIGEAAALAFAERGARVTIASRHQDKLTMAASRIGHEVSTAMLDTADEQAMAAFFERVAPFDHIVISASQTRTGSVRELSLEDAYASMNSKFWGAYRIAKMARINNAGSLTLVSGYRSGRPSATSVLQGAINAALDGLARGLAMELAPIRVNSVSPGLIATPLWSGMSEEARANMYRSAQEQLPARRVGTPEDVANAILYLAGTPYATGSTVLIDGGGTIA